MKIEISAERQAWLERESRRAGSASPADVVEAALRVYERHLGDLRRDIADAEMAIDAGEGVTETAAEFLSRMKLKHPPAV